MQFFVHVSHEILTLKKYAATVTFLCHSYSVEIVTYHAKMKYSNVKIISTLDATLMDEILIFGIRTSIEVGSYHFSKDLVNDMINPKFARSDCFR